jgi:lathosterol oxidase
MDYSVFVLKFLRTFSMLSLRYLLFAGVLYIVFYVWKKRYFLKYKIQQKFPDNPHIIREIKYSFLSLTVFSLVSLVTFTFRRMGYTKIYTDFNEHSVAYFIFSVLAFILIHDTYFYFAHRFMHWKKIYPYVHRIHHMSTNPTPWAAFAFHPVEALIEVAIVPCLSFLNTSSPFRYFDLGFVSNGYECTRATLVLNYLNQDLQPEHLPNGIILLHTITCTTNL